MGGSEKDAEVVTYKIPRIEVYQVMEDEICRIEEGYGQVSQDLTFATSFLSFGIAFLIAWLTSPFPSGFQTTFKLIVIVCGIGFLYTGSRWLSQRKKVPGVIAKIRSRKTEPQVLPPEKQ